MGGAWYRFRAELRHGSWRFVVITTLLLAIGGGVALAATAGARRTGSAFERLERSTLSADVLVNPDDVTVIDTLSDDVVSQLPGVEAHARVFGAAVLHSDGTLLEAVTLAASDERYGETIERPVVREGRRPDPARAYELFADPAGAELTGLEVGDGVDVIVITEADAEKTNLFALTLDELSELAASGQIGVRHRFTLVGVGVRTGDVIPGGTLPALYATPAFYEATRPLTFFGGITVRLSDPELLDTFVTKVRAQAPGVGIDFQTTAGDRATIQRAVRPQTIALVAFGLVTLVGVVAAVAQAFSRRAKVGIALDSILSGLGMTHRERRRLHVLFIALVTIVAPVLTVAVAYGLSGIFPVGVARSVEPERGRHFDPLVLLGGTCALVIAVVVASNVAVWYARRHGRTRSTIAVRVAQLASGVLPPTVTTGARLALDSGDRTTTVPAKSTIASAAVGVTVVIGALTFAAGLDRFVSTPSSYGWDFDAVIESGESTEQEDMELLTRREELMTRLSGVAGWTPIDLQQAPVAGENVPAMGIVDTGAGVLPHPTLVRGRIPSAREEVALGAVTARRAGVDIGDRVPVGFDDVPFEVVGIVVLPGIAEYEGSDQAALGVGALFAGDGFRQATSLGFQDDLSGWGRVLVALEDQDPDALDRLQAELDTLAGERKLIVTGPRRPSDVDGYAAIRSTPVVLAAILGALAAMTLGHGMIVSVRQRRRDFAVYRSLGFTRRQVLATVGWQATTVAVLAVVIGLPLGLALGRSAWSAVAHRLGIVDVPVTPLLAAALSLPIALALANVAAVVPARLGVRLRPAQELRAE